MSLVYPRFYIIINIPFFPFGMVSLKPPRLNSMTIFPEAMASIAVIPKSSCSGSDDEAFSSRIQVDKCILKPSVLFRHWLVVEILEMFI